MCDNRREVFAQVLRRGPTTGFLEDDIFGPCKCKIQGQCGLPLSPKTSL